MFVETLDAARASKITSQKIVDRAFTKFRAKHSDFDSVFPNGYEIEIGDGVTEKDVTDAIAKTYKAEKRRKEFYDQVRAQHAVIKELVRNGWKPPQQQSDESVVRRVRLQRQSDGSAIVEELD